jgi:hypothetical protein
MLEFARLAIPFFRIGWRVLLLGNDRPFARKLGIQLKEMFLVGREVIFGVDCIGRAFRFTQGAINAFIRVDNQEVRTFVKAVYGADLNAIGVLALDAVFGDHERHRFLLERVAVRQGNFATKWRQDSGLADR